MSRSESPASSLDYIDSDSSEEEYRRPAPRKKKTASAPLKINLTALKRAQDVASAYPSEDQVDIAEEEEFEEEDDEYDLSTETLKADHAARPLWIDSKGNM